MRISKEQISIWDEKSSSYQRFNPQKTTMQKHIIDTFMQFGIDFNSHIVDVGCGTGVFSLHLAKLAKSITCVDISSKMLEVLRCDAKRYGIFVNTFCGDFYELDKKFDLAFLSLSPAVNDEVSAKHFLNLAPKIAYINHIKPRYNEIITPILNSLREERKIFSFGKFLKQNNIHHQRKKISEKQMIEKSIFSIFDSLLWHLKINKINFDFDIIINLIDESLKDDFVVFTQNPNDCAYLKRKTKIIEQKSVYEMVVIS